MSLEWLGTARHRRRTPGWHPWSWGSNRQFLGSTTIRTFEGRCRWEIRRVPNDTRPSWWQSCRGGSRFRRGWPPGIGVAVPRSELLLTRLKLKGNIWLSNVFFFGFKTCFSFFCYFYVLSDQIYNKPINPFPSFHCETNKCKFSAKNLFCISTTNLFSKTKIEKQDKRANKKFYLNFKKKFLQY